MLKALLAVLVLAVAGGVVWYFASGNEKLQIGITPGKPLGDAAKIERHLISRGLTKSTMNPLELRVYFGAHFPDPAAVTATEFSDAVAGMKHCVVLVSGLDGKLLGVGGRFRSGAMDFSIIGTKCEHFIAVYWLRVAGGKPVLAKLQEGGADARDYFLSTVEKGGVRCSWRKDGGGGIVALPHEMVDTVSFVLP